MSTREFIHLHPLGMNPCDMDPDAYAEAANTWLCTGCGSPKPFVQAINVRIQDYLPEDTPLTFVSGCGVIIAHRSLLTPLRSSAVATDLLLGGVIGKSGGTMPGWATLHGRERVIVRGSQNVSYRRCDQCGRHVYFAMGTPYLFPAPPGDRSIYESDLYGLVVASNVVDLPSLKRWPKLGIDNLEVLHAPRDSLGELR